MMFKSIAILACSIALTAAAPVAEPLVGSIAPPPPNCKGGPEYNKPDGGKHKALNTVCETAFTLNSGSWALDSATHSLCASDDNNNQCCVSWGTSHPTTGLPSDWSADNMIAIGKDLYTRSMASASPDKNGQIWVSDLVRNPTGLCGYAVCLSNREDGCY